ncbi:hypothetical protein [Burkholderia cenocepacia]|uniref:hypothetical protein n=1 Tax=Burkholderia cenocepacia TaxID=95486 RepID=UPI00111579B3|nr:hypothetical protein [Burkholderia cenocepacia]
MAKHEHPKEFTKILNAIETLEQQGIKPTFSEISELTGKTSHVVRNLLKYHNQDLYKNLKRNTIKDNSWIENRRVRHDTLNRVKKAVSELNANGTKTNAANVGKHLGISRQRVHQILKASGELSILDNTQQREQKSHIAEALNAFDTAFLSVKEIQNLPIDGIKDISYGSLVDLLSTYNIPHCYSIEEKLSTIDTSQYTAKELHKLVGGHFRTMQQILYKKRLPFKSDRRNRQAVGIILKKLSDVDPSKYTSRDLYELVNPGGTLAAFRRILYDHKIQFKRNKKGGGKRKGFTRIASTMHRASLLQKLGEIETQNYSISQLAKMIGTTRFSLAPLIAEHKIQVYKNRRSKDEMAPIWEKLHSVDTTQYTANELLDLLENRVRHNVMLKYLDKHGMKYKRKKRATKFDKLLSIDTSQYTARELHSMTGGNFKPLQNYLAKQKLPYRNVKTGPKPKRLTSH